MRLTSIIFAFSILFLYPQVSSAADVLIAPPLFDFEAQPRDVITKDITITNQTDHKIYIYATVNEIAVDDTGEIKEFISPAMDDRTTAITSWIEISRGRVELETGEVKVIPLTVRINPSASEGEYHAFVGMITEANRPLAEAKALRGDGDGVIVKVNLADKSSDSLRIVSFLVDRFVITESRRIISLELKNEGTKFTTPTGEIIFYNSRGEEVASTPVNTTGEQIEPGTTKRFEAKVPFSNKLGRFKANATVQYGKEGAENIFDTAQFYMIPYKLLTIFVVCIVLFSLLVTYLIRRVFYDELQSGDEEGEIPLRIRRDRTHSEHDHDIHITKN